jgi:hypothetical protein
MQDSSPLPLCLKFEHILFELYTSSPFIKNKILSEFDFFLVPHTFIRHATWRLHISVTNSHPTAPKSSYLVWKSHKSRVYKKQNDYFINWFSGKVITYEKREQREVWVNGMEENAVWEVLYLFLHAKVGKTLDYRGIHRLHACAFAINNRGFAVSMPSGGGKSTFLYQLIKIFQNSSLPRTSHPSVTSFALLSDDSPFIHPQGTLGPFPTRLSLDLPPEETSLPEASLFLRQNYLPKWTYPLSKMSVASETQDVPCAGVFFGTRSNHVSQITALSAPLFFFYLLAPFIFGIGLPQVIEFFFSFSFRDFPETMKILFLRTKAAYRLTQTTQGFKFSLSNDPKQNVETFLKWRESCFP